MAFALQIKQNQGCKLLPQKPHIPCYGKICYALQPHRPPLFCLISPEAALLTGRRKTKLTEPSVNLKIRHQRCSGGTGKALLLTFTEHKRKPGVFFGYFLLRKKKVTFTAAHKPLNQSQKAQTVLIRCPSAIQNNWLTNL